MFIPLPQTTFLVILSLFLKLKYLSLAPRKGGKTVLISQKWKFLDIKQATLYIGFKSLIRLDRKIL